MPTTVIAVEPSAPVKRVELPDLLTEIEDAYNVFSGWAARLAATKGPEAQFLTRELDGALSAMYDARGAVRWQVENWGKK